MQREKELLFRKVNTKSRGVRHNSGGDYRWSRNAKSDSRAARGSMGGKAQRGLDYTPLFRFLLSKVGEDWDRVFSEAMSRLDREEPIWWLVARTDADRKPFVRIGESTLFSGLYVDCANRLALVDPLLRNEDLVPDCACCTHTFNGERLIRKFAAG